MEKAHNEKRAIWEKRISEQEASGLARKPWCARHGIQYTTFRYWLEKTGKLPAAKKPIVRVFRQVFFPKNGVKISLSGDRDFCRAEEVTSSS